MANFADIHKKNRLFLDGKDELSKTFFGQLFFNTSPFLSVIGLRTKVETSKNIPSLRPQSIEKEKVIESLTNFSEKILGEDESKIVNDILIQKVETNESDKSCYNSFEVDNSSFEMVFKNSSNEIEVLFIGGASGLSDNQEGESEATKLLEKMIEAMKIPKESYSTFLYPENFLDNEESKSNLLKSIKEKKPKIILSLGAQSTNFFLGKREKLSNIHGKFFEIGINEHLSFKLVPIFHPDFLLINPNMKRSAWIDLQEVMKFLNIPS